MLLMMVILFLVALAEVVSHAVDSLMEQLPNDEKPEIDGPMPPPGEKVKLSLWHCTNSARFWDLMSLVIICSRIGFNNRDSAWQIPAWKNRED